jgi:alkanesulfonate monooxygenase SsuD/methylene tetrahydromethanopterin reductase-like flavin-dependent oxidoreductase (luciferase family)
VPPQFAPQVYRTIPKPTVQAGRSGGNGAQSAKAEQPAASAGQNAATLVGINAEQAMARGLLFAGSPDTVYQQIVDFYDKVGGFGHLVMIGRSGFMTHAEAEKGIKLFGQEVLPRLKEIAPVTVG